jgi:hypothetical protein
MSVEDLKAEVKKLNARATKAKMDLHDLSEDLPIGWENILSVAQTAHDAYSELTGKRAALKLAEGG